MSYTGNEVRREAEQYQAWAKQRDREQFLAYVRWIRDNHQRIRKEEGIYESECRMVSA